MYGKKLAWIKIIVIDFIFLGVMNRLMYNCNDATFVISKGRHQKLTFSEKQKLRMHLAFCKHCRAYNRDIAILEKNINMATNNTILENPIYKLPQDKKVLIKKMMSNL